jgi:PRTRC genetic system protein C
MSTFKPVKRTITFEGKVLADIPGFSPQQLKTHYSKVRPELATATIEENVTAQGITIRFVAGYDSKG